MRRISDALGAPGGLDADAALRERLDADPEAARYAQDLGAIDEALRGLGAARREPDWEAMLGRIEDALDADAGFDDGLDATAPPQFADEPSARRVAAPPVAAAGGEVVDLSARREQRNRVFALAGAFAAAAAVGMGVMAGLSMDRGAPAEMSAAPAVQSVDVPADLESAAVPEPMAAAPTTAPAEGEREEQAAVAYAAPAVPAPTATAIPAEAPAPPVVVARGVTSGGGFDGLGARAPARGAGGGGSGYATGSTSAGEFARGDRADQPAAEPPVTREPSRVEVVNALNQVAHAVASCMVRTREVAEVRVRVEGATGRVETVTVRPPFTGAEAACIRRAVQSASMPRSAHATYEVTHAYHPAPTAGGSLSPAAPAARRARAAPGSGAERPAARQQLDLLNPY
ncbi:MAG: hypothetical protein KF729_28075 [Sandaracinaceae bacterium]|nr:hypothetical protein [Sandaracinaceae bacterium]